jgi:hypothetical protein
MMNVATCLKLTVAGFDLTVPIPTGERQFASILLRSVQRRATAYGIQLRYGWNKQRRAKAQGIDLQYQWSRYNHYHVQIDGNLMQIELFCADLQLFCEAFGMGYNAATNTLRDSITPTAVAGFIIIALRDFHKNLGQFGDLLSSKGLHFSLGSAYFDLPARTGLSKSTKSLTNAIVAYHDGRSNSEQLAEQLHTTSEHLMRKIVPASKDLTYAQLTDRMVAMDRISREQSNALLAIKKLRRGSKHQGQNIRDSTLKTHLNSVVAAVHTMVAFLRMDQKIYKDSAT